MKKLLLLAGAMGIASMSFGQDFVGEGCDGPSIDTHHVYDDFSGDAPFLWRPNDAPDFERRYGAGFYPWEDTTYHVVTLGSTPERNVEGEFSYSLERITDEGYLRAIVTQPVGAFEPFGISFGDRNEVEYPEEDAAARFFQEGPEEEDPITLDFRPHPRLYAIISNKSDVDIDLRISLQDVNGHTADTYPTVHNEDDVAQAFEHTIFERLPANTDNIEIEFDYTGAVEMEWFDHPERAERGAGQLHEVDLSQISSVNFTLASFEHQLEGMANDPEWFHAGLDDVEIHIHSIRIGDCSITPIMKPVANKGMKIAPNPASSQARVSYDMVRSGNVEVRVSDMMGATVASFNGGRTETEVPVSNLNKGIYVVTVYGDGVPVSASRLVVE